MPSLYEFQGKELLKASGIAIPRGGMASTPEAAKDIAAEIGKTVVIKAQVLATGRYAAGGVKFADTPEEVEKIVREMMGITIKGSKVERVLVEEKLKIRQEFYAGVIIDDSCKVKSPVLILSSRGGSGIEEIAAQFPETVGRLEIDILEGLKETEVKSALKRISVPEDLLEDVSKIVCRIFDTARKNDLRSLEANPIIATEDGGVFAADCHAVIDDASVFRHPELGITYPRDIGRDPTELEMAAWQTEEGDFRGTAYFVQMNPDRKAGEGYVGFHGIGGGGAMLGADALIRHGLKIANYADTSGNPTASKVYRIVKLILSQPDIEAYVLMGACVANQDQWHHANAIARALQEELPKRPNFPVVLLIAGNKETESIEILQEALKGVSSPVEIYGREYVYKVDQIADRVKALVEEYREFKEKEAARDGE